MATAAEPRGGADGGDHGGERSGGGGGAIVIKKYANRRLYNTATSSYVTLDHLCRMVKDGQDFVVRDARTGEDITRAVLTQIIVEEEAKGPNMLPEAFLRQLIRFYGDNLQMVVPPYLEAAMSAFTDNQDRTRAQMQETLGGMFPFAPFEEMSRRNMAVFEQAARLFTPAGGPGRASAGQGPGGPEASPPGDPPSRRADADRDAAIHDLQRQMHRLQEQLNRLSGNQPDRESGQGKV